ncbi:hypothetical protein FB639_002136 [Coemansia asiatica]|nr:hypothetical protein FB639_002136 [Coemansia asiatica]
MDDDDICPICEDECTCRNSRPAASVHGVHGVHGIHGIQHGASGDNNSDDGPPMPLFSQIALIDSHQSLLPAKKRESTSRKTGKKTESRASKAATTKPRPKPRAKKGKGSEKTLISHMVEEIDIDSGEYELFGLSAHIADANTQPNGVSISDNEKINSSNSSSCSSGDEYDFSDSQFASAMPASRTDALLLALAGSQTQPSNTVKSKAKEQAKPKNISNPKPRPKAKPKSKAVVAATKRGRPPKSAASAGNDGWQKKKQSPKSGTVEPLVYEVNATVIRGRDRRPSVTKRGISPNRMPSEALSGEDDEFINITDFTSDASAAYPSETEFDLPSTQGEEAPTLASWSDAASNLLADEEDDDDIEKSEEAYLIRMHEKEFSSSSLSDLDEERMAGIRRGRTRPQDLDSGEESDSESNDGENPGVIHRARRRKAASRNKQHIIKYREIDIASDIESLSDIGSIGSLASDNESETDQELTFRQARTAEERALAEYAESSDEREDALLNMHLEQLRTVRNAMPGCPLSSPLFDAEGSGSDAISDVEMEIAFTYHSDNSSDDGSKDLSDDLMEGWGSDTRRRWEADSDSSSDSSLSESKIDRLRLKGDEDDDNSDLYSSDSYDEFYSRSAFLDMNSDDDGVALEDALYPPGMDLDSASLALGVALSMEQQGYSKEDAAAAAAVAAAAYPGANASEAEGSAGVLGKPSGTTTITASMNANGEADPIDGIVSIKSSSKTAGATRMATGTNTPFFPSGWHAAAAAAYLDNQNQPALSYVLPKDLNEARSPSIALAAATVAEAQAEADAMVAAVVGSESVFAERHEQQNGEKASSHPATLCLTDVELAESPKTLDIISAATTATIVPSEQVSAKHACEEYAKPNFEIMASDIAASTRRSHLQQQPQSATATATSFTSQLRNSSFYKPLSSICSPIRRASSSSALSQQPSSKHVTNASAAADQLHAIQQSAVKVSSLDAQKQVVEPINDASNGFIPGAPLVSLAEVNAALSVLAEESAPASPAEHNLSIGSDYAMSGRNDNCNILKRKISDNSIAAGIVGDDKRARGDDVAFAGKHFAVNAETDADTEAKAESEGGSYIPIDMSMLFAASSSSCSAVSSIPARIARPGTPQRASNSIVAMGAGTPIRGSMTSLGDGHETESDMDDWLMTMDQLVDTDALMIKSPPPSPAEGAVADLGPEISRQLSSIGVLGSQRPDSASSSAGGLDMLSRWDRIPINIFRRSRALASSHRRGMVSQDDMMGTMSSLALTAIKSSRQRRALVNTTLLAQHTLPAEATLQQQAFKHALRNSSSSSGDSGNNGKGGGRRSGKISRALSSAMMAPPPPPPTPLSQIASNTHRRSSMDTTSATAMEPSVYSSMDTMLESSNGVAKDANSKVSAFSAFSSQTNIQSGSGYYYRRQLSFSGSAASDAEIDQQPSHHSLLGRSNQMQPRSSAENVAEGLESQLCTDDPARSNTTDYVETAQTTASTDPSMSGVDNGSDCEYAFGWLEDEDDLALFAMPELQNADGSGSSSFQEPQSLTMMLASAGPMLMPYRAKNSNGGDAGSDTHF